MQNPAKSNAADPLAGHAHYEFRKGGYSLIQREVSDMLQWVYTDLEELPFGSTVLDIGCGDGRFPINAPPDRPYNVLGIDVSESAVQAFNTTVHKAVEPRRGRIADRAVRANLGVEGALNLTGLRVKAAVSWRALHTLAGDEQVALCQAVHEMLPPGGHFHLGVLSEIDWKCTELGASYVPGELNDCRHVMRIDDAWPLFFFSEKDLHTLADASGFAVLGTGEFREQTGYKHLVEMGRPDIEYRYARFVKKS